MTQDLRTAMMSRRAFAAGSAAAAAALAASGTALAAADAPANEIVIFHTNDTHGYLEGDGESCVGIDYVAGLHACMPNSLLLDAGDISQGAPLASLSKGAQPFELFNAAGYDAACLGNHEFDFGLETLLGNAEYAQFPLLSANATYREGGDPLMAGRGASGNGCWTVLECAGRRVGVFGITTSGTVNSVTPSAVVDVAFLDEVEAAETCIAALDQEGVDAIVALCHLGDADEVPCTAIELVQSLSPEVAGLLDVVVDGHSHTVENDLVNGILVVQTGCHLANVGKVTLAFAEDGSVAATGELFDPVALAEAALEPDPATSEALTAAVAQHAEYLETPVCANPTTLWGGWVGDGAIAAPPRIVQTNLGSFACDAYRDAAMLHLAGQGDQTTPVLAIQNGGGVRAKLPRGMVCAGDFVGTFPFANSVMLKTVTPKFLRAIMENSFDGAEGQDTSTGMLLQDSVSGDFNQVSGFKVVVDPNAPAGERVVQMTLDATGEALDLDDDQTPLVLVSNSYVMTGGGYPPLAELPLLAEIGSDLDILMGFAQTCDEKNGGEGLPLIAGCNDCIAYRGGYEPAPWTATLRLLDASGDPLPNQRATVQVDAMEVFAVESNGEGLLQVALEDGPHSIALIALGDDAAEPPAVGVDCDETYVDNYMGIGLVEDDLRAWPELKVRA